MKKHVHERAPLTNWVASKTKQQYEELRDSFGVDMSAWLRALIESNIGELHLKVTEKRAS